MRSLAPICLFTFNRLYETQRTIEALAKNAFADESDLFIFSDGSFDEDSASKVKDVRDYLSTINGFKSVKIFESKNNKGLAGSIITGVTKVLENFNKIIVVEDDLITSVNFLYFMNLALEKYEKEEQIFSISGFSPKINIPKDYSSDVFFWSRAHSWGWAVWKNRWNTVDWKLHDYEDFISDKNLVKSFSKLGTDVFSMLKKSKNNQISSWYIRFTYNQFRQNKLTVYPILSKVINNGFMDGATNCDTYNRNDVNFDIEGSLKIKVSDQIIEDERIVKRLFYLRSYPYRIQGKILTLMMKAGLIKQRILKT